MIQETVKRNVVFTNLDNQVTGLPAAHAVQHAPPGDSTSCLDSSRRLRCGAMPANMPASTGLPSALPGTAGCLLQLARLARKLPQGELAVLSRQLGGDGGSAAVGATSEGEEDLT